MQEAGSYERGRSQGRTPGQQGPHGGQRTERISKEDTTKNLFVGNLPHGCTEKDLSDLFSNFGRVLEVRINQRGGDGKAGYQVPNFAFIVFEDAASLERTLRAKPILLNGNHRLNVEEKKRRRYLRTTREVLVILEVAAVETEFGAEAVAVHVVAETLEAGARITEGATEEAEEPSEETEKGVKV